MLVLLVLVHGIGEAFFAPAFSALVPDILAPTMIPQASAIEQIVRQAARNFARPRDRRRHRRAVRPGDVVRHRRRHVRLQRGVHLRDPHAPGPVRERAAGVIAELREGIAYVRTQTWLWGTLIAASLAILFFMGPLQVLVPYVVKNDLDAGSGATARSSRSRAPARSRCRSGSARGACRAARSAG